MNAYAQLLRTLKKLERGNRADVRTDRSTPPPRVADGRSKRGREPWNDRSLQATKAPYPLPAWNPQQAVDRQWFSELGREVE